MNEKDVKDYIELAKRVVNVGGLVIGKNPLAKKVLDKVAEGLNKEYLPDLVLFLVSLKDIAK